MTQDIVNAQNHDASKTIIKGQKNSRSRRCCRNTWRSVVVKLFAFGLCWLRFSSSSSPSPSSLMPSSLELHPAVTFADCFVKVRQLATKRTIQSTNVEGARAKNSLNINQTSGPSGGSDDERSDQSYSKDITDNNKNDQQQSWLSSIFHHTSSLEMRLDATLVSIYVLARFLVYDIASGAKDIPGLDIQDWVRILSAVSSAIILSGCWSLCGLVVTNSFQVQQEEENEQDQGKAIIPIDDYLRTVTLTLVNTALSIPIWFLLERAFNFGPPGFDLRDYSSIEVLLSTGLGLAVTMIVAKTTTNGWK